MDAFELQGDPRVLVAKMPGTWLLKHATPSWRSEDPEKGFQRIVNQERAREIATTVLNAGRAFPNAIVLATDNKNLSVGNGKLRLPSKIEFLVIDGQHRLWAQKFASRESTYACAIHVGLSLIDMARLFLEINDTQRRVPPSLRWDLVRLVRPEGKPNSLAAAEIVFDLATTKGSPLFQRVDLTGEQGELNIKQASLAPEIEALCGAKSTFGKLPFDGRYQAIEAYLAGIKQVDPSGWRDGTSPLAKARVLRALIRLLPRVAAKLGRSPDKISGTDYLKVLKGISLSSLSTPQIVAAQGSAGIKAIAEMLAQQMKLPAKS